jgi:hypothetical protein
LDTLDSLNREQLIQIILDQHRMIEELRAEIEQLKRRGAASKHPSKSELNRPVTPPSAAGILPRIGGSCKPKAHRM